MIGLSLTATVRAAKKSREYWKDLAERAAQRTSDLAKAYGDALIRSEALQRQMAAWLTNKAGDITPEQAAQMFYAQDDKWQAAFFNVMQAQVLAIHEADGNRYSAGVPAGEGQWYHMGKFLDRSGFETMSAMHEHAVSHSEQMEAF